MKTGSAGVQPLSCLTVVLDEDKPITLSKNPGGNESLETEEEIDAIYRQLSHSQTPPESAACESISCPVLRQDLQRPVAANLKRKRIEIEEGSHRDTPRDENEHDVRRRRLSSSQDTRNELNRGRIVCTIQMKAPKANEEGPQRRESIPSHEKVSLRWNEDFDERSVEWE